MTTMITRHSCPTWILNNLSGIVIWDGFSLGLTFLERLLLVLSATKSCPLSEMAVRVLLFIASVLPVTVLGHQDGAGAEACLDLIPHHDASTASTTTAPYSITVNTTSIKQGTAVTVTLNATTAGDTFKGFLVQARCTKCTTADTAIVPGTFAKYTASDDTIQTMKCAGGVKNSMTHTSKIGKTSAVFTWTAPSDFDVSQGVQFRATIVKDKPTWWTNVASQEISITGTNSGPHVAPVLAVVMAFCILGSSLLA